jgi:mannose-6-phosphate isomerase-like protein (cupin superfamily)
MPRTGDHIENVRTGQRMTFQITAEDSDGALVRFDSFNPPCPFEPVHVHPEQESSAEVLSGALLFVVGGREIRLGPGDRTVIPAGMPHTFRNEGPEEAHSIMEFRPALKIAECFETLFALAQRGELDARGMPSVLQLALSGPAFGREMRLPSPPWLIQRLALAPLAPLARLRGLRPTYSWEPIAKGAATTSPPGESVKRVS